MVKINFKHKYPRLLDDVQLVGSTISDLEYNYKLDQTVYLVQLITGEKLAMIADHYTDGSNSIGFYDLEKQT